MPIFMEYWKDVNGFEGEYQVSNYGRVLSVYKPSSKKGMILKPYPNPKGYLWVSLLKNGIEKRRQVHRIVMEAFRGKSDLFVNHKDLNPKNNKLCNLEYVTHTENIHHAIKNGAFPDRSGENNSRSNISNKDRDDIVELRKTKPTRFIANKYGLSMVHTQRIIREWGR